MKKENFLTSGRERFAFNSYMIGQNIYYFTITMFLSTYLLLNGLTPAMTATAIFIVKAWDSVNDLFFGGMIDKIQFKNGGKFLPYLKVSLIFIPIATVLMYAIPSFLTPMQKVIWFTIAYILWDTAYTVCDAPLHGLVTTMTNVQNERTYIMSQGRISASVGAGFAMLLGFVLTSEYGGLSYTVVAIIMSVIGLVTMIPIVLFGKERINVEREEEQGFGIKEVFTFLKTNKMLSIYFLGYTVSQVLNCGQAFAQISAYYLFENSMVSMVIGLMTSIPVFVIGAFMPRIIRRFDKMKIMIYMSILSAVIGIVKYFIGYEDLVIYMVLTIIGGMVFAPVPFCAFMFTPDCVEYGKFKTGIDARGVAFSIQTFSVKIGASFASVIGLALLGVFGWQEVQATDFADLARQGITQSKQAIDGLWFITTLVPSIGTLLSTLIWSKYKLNDKDSAIMAQCNNGEISREEAEQLLSKEY